MKRYGICAFVVQIHTFKPGWMDASAAFMRSGGYKVSKRISDVQQDTTVVWGRNDEVLDAKDAQAFVKILPHAKSISPLLFCVKSAFVDC